jgi:dihydroorotase
VNSLTLSDLLLKNGTLVDPSQQLHTKRDVMINKGYIVQVEKDISPDQASEVIDAEDCLITPGFIDLHVHCYPGVSHYGIDADTHSLAHGVTTVLDAGSAGADTFEGFRRYVVNVSATRIYALLNISSMGMISPHVGELEDIRFANVEKAIDVIEKNRDIIQGVKVRMSTNIIGKNDKRPLILAKRVSEAVKMPLMVHPGNTPMPLSEILGELTKQDILTHCFHGNQHGILNSQGGVLDAVTDAVKRGIILDVGHGRGSFSFDVARKALSQGVTPRTISSDLHFYNVCGPVYNLATTVSKFVHLGLSIDEAVAKVTSTPAKLLGIEDNLGTLRKNSIADIAIFKLVQGNIPFEDTMGKIETGTSLFKPVSVIKAGRVFSSSLRVQGR